MAATNLSIAGPDLVYKVMQTGGFDTLSGVVLPTIAKTTTPPVYTITVKNTGAQNITLNRMIGVINSDQSYRMKINSLEWYQLGSPGIPFNLTLAPGATTTFTAQYAELGTINSPSGLFFEGSHWFRGYFEYTEGASATVKIAWFDIAGIMKRSPGNYQITFEEFQSRFVGGWSSNASATPTNPLGLGVTFNGHLDWVTNYVIPDYQQGLRNFLIWLPFGRTHSLAGRTDPDIDLDSWIYVQEAFPNAPENRWWNQWDAAMQLFQSSCPGATLNIYTGSAADASSFHNLLDAGDTQGFVRRWLTACEPFLKYPFINIIFDDPHSHRCPFRGYTPTSVTVAGNAALSANPTNDINQNTGNWPGHRLVISGRTDALNGVVLNVTNSGVYTGGNTTFRVTGGPNITVTDSVGNVDRIHFIEPGQPTYEMYKGIGAVLRAKGRIISAEPRCPYEQSSWWSKGASGYDRTCVEKSYWVSDPDYSTNPAATGAASDSAMGPNLKWNRWGTDLNTFTADYFLAEVLANPNHTPIFGFFLYRAFGVSFTQLYNRVNALLGEMSS